MENIFNIPLNPRTARKSLDEALSGGTLYLFKAKYQVQNAYSKIKRWIERVSLCCD
jgi:hypothetical protein